MNDSARPDAETAPPLIIIGAGGHARVLIETLRKLGRRVIKVVDDDHAKLGAAFGPFTVEPTRAVESTPTGSCRLVNAVGSNHRPTARRAVFERFAALGHRFATIVDPDAVVARSASLGEGAQVIAGGVVQPEASIGRNCLINTGATIDHDCRLEDHVHVAPGATLCGGVRVGHTSHIGCGVTVIESVSIGDEVFVAAGSTVVRDLPDGAEAMGVPARVLRTAGRGADP